MHEFLLYISIHTHVSLVCTISVEREIETRYTKFTSRSRNSESRCRRRLYMYPCIFYVCIYIYISNVYACVYSKEIRKWRRTYAKRYGEKINLLMCPMVQDSGNLSGAKAIRADLF
jgi:hypothetical protein